MCVLLGYNIVYVSKKENSFNTHNMCYMYCTVCTDATVSWVWDFFWDIKYTESKYMYIMILFVSSSFSVKAVDHIIVMRIILVRELLDNLSQLNSHHLTNLRYTYIITYIYIVYTEVYMYMYDINVYAHSCFRNFEQASASH